MKEGTKLIVLFMALTGIGFVFYYFGENGKNTGWEIYTVMGTASTFALAVIAFFGYVKYLKDEDTVKIKFHLTTENFTPKGVTFDKNGNIETGLYLQRRHCTRSEIQGLLRMIMDKELKQ